MSKNHQRSNKEKKKPKQDTSKKPAVGASPFAKGLDTKSATKKA